MRNASFHRVASGEELLTALSTSMDVDIALTDDIVATRDPAITFANNLVDIIQTQWIKGRGVRNGLGRLSIRGDCRNSSTLTPRKCEIDLQRKHALNIRSIERTLMENFRLLNGKYGGMRVYDDKILPEFTRIWVNDVTFQDGFGNTGALSFTNGAKAWLKGCQFIGNSGKAVAAVFVRNSTLVMEDCQLIDNSVNGVNGTTLAIFSGEADELKNSAIVLLNVESQPADSVFGFIPTLSGNLSAHFYSKDEAQISEFSEVTQLPSDWHSRRDYLEVDDEWVSKKQQLFKADSERRLALLCAARSTCRNPTCPGDCRKLDDIPCSDGGQVCRPGYKCITSQCKKDDDELNVGLIVGLTVGLAVVLLLCMLAGLFVVRRQRRARPKQIDLEAPPKHPTEKIDVELARASMEKQNTFGTRSSESTSLLSTQWEGNWTSVYALPHSHELDPTTWIRTAQRPATSKSLCRKQLNHQLDYLCEHKATLLNKYKLLGQTERRQGGQGVVQFVSGVLDNASYVVKFFLDRPSFEREQQMYQDPVLQKIMPAISDVVSNDDGFIQGRSGVPLPPFIVIERGESLNEWAIKRAPDFWTTMMVLQHIAERLQQLHSFGMVHCDLKPENILWRPKHKEWTLIDFGCAATAGETLQMAYSPLYAAPETIEAVEKWNAVMTVAPSIDMWSFGVIAFELLTKSRAFDLHSTMEVVAGQLRGRQPLPWEPLKDRDNEQLMILGPSVLAMLQRNPLKRPSMKQLLESWKSLFRGSEITAPTVYVHSSEIAPKSLDHSHA